ncbi:hypothetical protein [Fodinibius sp.]|uniref:hypothetical protein n=1 Tax=Fodinibius sp. TaxID=1872440 RepID=UPI002ACE4435|nr:hypothetical protein [Fodinibius sp.]MDZ7659286.1 hypothetical protein [Fodinibius sp.]
MIGRVLLFYSGYMTYFIFGFAVGVFVSGLIEKYHKNEATNWINSSYLFLISGITFVIYIYLDWSTLQEVFENLFS